MLNFFKIIFIILFISFQANAENADGWLKNEIDKILNIYKNENLSEIEKFENIEDTINKNFAGSGIAKFVSGKAWASADKNTKKNYINLFKRHLALNIASMMKGYSNQTYKLVRTKKDESTKVILIDMEIIDQTSNILITWRIKESKGRYYVIDLLVADISLVVTKRSEFNSMLKKVDYNLKKFNKTLNEQNNISFNKILNNN
tara:strand:- start:184 stop:792 length:609 start_codon:yes stop_codon:yes gene_type:complete